MELGTAGWNTQTPRCRFPPGGGGRARQRAVRKAAVLVAFLVACCVLSRIKTLTPESYTSSYLAGRRLLGAVAEADVDVSQPEPDVDPGPPRYARLKRAPPDSGGQEGDPDGAEPRGKPTGGDKGKAKGKAGGGDAGGEKPTNATKGNGKAGPEGTVQVDSADNAADKDGKTEPKQPSGEETPKEGGGTGAENPEKEPPGGGEGKPAKPDKNSEESPPKGEAVGSTDDVGRKEEGKPKQGEPEGRPEEPETKPESTEAKPKEGGKKEPTANAKPGGEPDGGAKPGKDTNGESKPKEQDEETAEPKARKPGEETADGKEPKNDDSSADGKKTEPGPNVEVAPKNGSNSNATKTPQGKEKEGNETANEGDAVDCIRPAYHEFPPDLFSHDARAKGGVIVHILVVLYMFYALAVVCDDYFIASLEECCARLNLSEDVAGATFMAAGSSAPELFTAILGVLVAKGDVGTGTIVGSAVFNVLFVIGLCGLCSGKEVPVTWWPLFRDSIFYAFTVVILILVIYDGEVTWYDSLSMLLLYGVYIDIMKYNNRIHHWVGTTFGIHEEEQTSLSLTAAACDGKNYSSYVPFNNEIDDYAQPRSLKPPLDEVIRDSRRRPSLYEAALRMLMTRYFRPKTRFWAAAKRITHEYKRIRRGEIQHLPSQTSLDPNDMVRRGKSSSVDVALSTDADWKRIPRLGEGPWRLLKWCLQAPLLATLHYTVPDCRTATGKRLFMLSFLMSIFWTAVFSYVMVWMVTLIGYTMGIPDTIMGITFLAAGTSIPDAYASLLVSRQGQGDMAIANSIGSNVFDILIGLALPWLIQTGMVQPGSLAYINSGGLVWSVVLLFLTIIITIYAIHRSHWLLTKRLGVFLLVVYVFFLIFCSALEFNLLGYVNPPMCTE